jgi:lipoic acid synthetase
MSEFKGIPIIPPHAVRSGEKYVTPQGFTAVKDGVKRAPATAAGSNVAPRKPPWLRAKLASGAGFESVKNNVREHRLSTVCEEAKCPNIGECWNAGTATIMLMGAVCTRACRFCAVDTGNPRGWLDPEEPENVARSVELMGLKYVVLTSVNRDDLADGGAAHYAAAVRAIKKRNPGTAVEALTPDFQGVMGDVHTVLESGLDVFAQNVETVRRLTHPVRDPRAAAVDLLTLGQYLRPTANHLAVERFVAPHEFDRYREWALALGFLECVSGPLVRSSYRAEQALARNNAGLDNAKLSRHG